METHRITSFKELKKLTKFPKFLRPVIRLFHKKHQWQRIIFTDNKVVKTGIGCKICGLNYDFWKINIKNS